MITEIFSSRVALTDEDADIIYSRWNGLSPPRTIVMMLAGDRCDAAAMLARSMQRADDLKKYLLKLDRNQQYGKFRHGDV